MERFRTVGLDRNRRMERHPLSTNASFVSNTSSLDSTFDPFYDVMEVFEGGRNRDRRSMSDTLDNSSRKAAHIGRVVYTGWLTKQGHIWKSWKKRFFVLQTRIDPKTGKTWGSLQYYKNNKFGKMKGELSMADVPITVRFLDIQKTSRPYCFEIVRGFYTLICQARDEQDADTWVGHIQSILNSERKDEGTAIMHRALRSSTIGDMFCQNISVELRRLLDNPKSPEGARCNFFIRNFDYRSPNAVKDVRRFICNSVEVILNNHASTFLEIMGQETNLSSMNDVTKIVTRHLEESVFLPLHDGIYCCLRRLITEDAEENMNKKVLWLHGKDQTYFNIPLNQMSWSKWRSPIAKLRLMATYSLPSDKFESLLQAIAEIHNCYRVEHHTEFEKMLNIDDILPIFTYVLVNSGLENLLTLKVLLYTMCHSGNDDSEWGGGCMELEIFAASLDYIANVSIPAVFENIFNEQVSFDVDGEWKMGIEFEEEPVYHFGAIVKTITSNGQSALSGVVVKGSVLVSVQGRQVILLRFEDILYILNTSQPPLRLAFISSSQYFRILAINFTLWNDALLECAKRGNIEELQVLLANGASINCVDKMGNTPLHIASGALHFGAVSYLVQHGAKVKSVEGSGRTPLHMLGCPPNQVLGDPSDPILITPERDENVVRSIIIKLVRSGALVDAVDIFGNTPLMLLARSGSVLGVETLINCGAEIDARNWTCGYTPLASAALESASPVVERLLSQGANPNIGGLDGVTPLHIAASSASVEICRMLVQKSAIVNARTNTGVIPLVMALSRGRLRSGVDFEQIHVDDASVRDTVEFLLDNGGDVHHVCQLYRQPLHYSVLYGSPDMVKLLLQKKVDANACDLNDNSSLQLLEKEMEVHLASKEDMSERKSSQLSDWQQIQGLLLNSMPTCKEEPRRNPFEYSNINFLMKNGRRELESGKVDDIVKFFLIPENFSPSDVEAFLCAGVQFCGFSELLDIIKETYRKTVSEFGEVRALRKVLLYWFDLWAQLVDSSPVKENDCLVSFSAFVAEIIESCETDDPCAIQWLSFSYLPKFIKSCYAGTPRPRYFAKILPCNWVYSKLYPLVQQGEGDPTFCCSDLDMEYSTCLNKDELKRKKRMHIAGLLQEPKPVTGLESDALTCIPSTVRHRSTSSMGEKADKFFLLNCDPGLMAQQITLLQHYLFQGVPTSEILHSKKGAVDTPFYEKMRAFHNHCSLWVVNQILGRNEVAERAAVLGFFISVAAKCCSPLRNFDGLMAIVNALNDSSIFRLKLTWGRLSQPSKESWNDLKKMTEKGGRPLSKIMKSVLPPCVPYIGIILQHLVAFQEFPDFTPKNLIIFNKVRSVGTIATQLRQLQRTPYLFGPDPELLVRTLTVTIDKGWICLRYDMSYMKEYLQGSLQYCTNDACFKRSLEVEPRIATS